jgi:uncharacterized protein YciI
MCAGNARYSAGSSVTRRRPQPRAPRQKRMFSAHAWDTQAWAGLGDGGGPYPAGMANFAVRLIHGPGWDPSRPIRDQGDWAPHAAFINGLVDADFIILGGPVGDGEETLHVVEAADEKEVRARLAADPWAQAGLLRVGTIEPWALWLDSRPRK